MKSTVYPKIHSHGTDGADIQYMERTRPLVTVLIVTWNRCEDVLETIQTVYEQAYDKIEIVIVDNGSRDGTVDAVRQRYPDVKLVDLDRNVGIAAGRNAGIAVARGEIIFFLDSDASPDADALAKIVQRLQADARIGVINSKIVNASSGELDRGPGWVYSEKQKAHQDEEFWSFSFSEGGAAIRKNVLDQTGPFWDTLFFGCEGQELSLRVWDAGYKILYYPEATVFHRASPKSRIDGSQRDCLFVKNTLYIYFVRYPWWLMVIFMPAKIGTALIRSACRGYLRNMLGALAAFVQDLPQLWRQRHPIRRQTARHYLRLQREHGALSWDFITWLTYKT